MLSYERYLQLVGGRECVAAALEQQARAAGETLTAGPPRENRQRQGRAGVTRVRRSIR